MQTCFIDLDKYQERNENILGHSLLTSVVHLPCFWHEILKYYHFLWLYTYVFAVQGRFATKSIRFKSFRYNSKSIRYTDSVDSLQLEVDSLQTSETQKLIVTQLNLIHYRIWTREFLKNIRAFDSNDGIMLYFPVSSRDDYSFT